MMLLAAATGATARERPILIEVEELPRSEVRQITQSGHTAEGAVPFILSVEKARAPRRGSTIGLTLGRLRFGAVHLAYLPFDALDSASISTHSRDYSHGRVFRVHLRYGEPAPSCRIGDDGRGKVTITYRKGHAPEIGHRPPSTVPPSKHCP